MTPTHPGFAGEPRPEWFDSIDDLAFAYLDLLERLDLRDVLVIGSSMGGWIAAAMALRDTTRRLGGLVLVDAGGIRVDEYPIADVSTLTPDELSALSFHNPAAFRVDPATVSPEQAAARAANLKALYVYDQGQGMGDPKLRRRLRRVSIPALVVWGESDRVILPEYGRVYAQSFLTRVSSSSQKRATSRRSSSLSACSHSCGSSRTASRRRHRSQNRSRHNDQMS